MDANENQTESHIHRAKKILLIENPFKRECGVPLGCVGTMGLEAISNWSNMFKN